MTKEIDILKREIETTDAMAMISACLGKPANDPKVFKFIASAMMYIQSKVGTKGDVSKCTKQSIISSLIDAATAGLAVDNRHYACLIAYKDNAAGTLVCSYQPEWRGYVAKIKEADHSAKVTSALIYKGDRFSHVSKNGEAFYTHERDNSIADKIEDMTGAYCYIKTDTGSSIEVMSRFELDKVRKSSKAGFAYIWNDWPHEQYKKTITRRGCKMGFTEAVADLDAMDNKMYISSLETDGETVTEISKSPQRKITAQAAPKEIENSGRNENKELIPEEIEAKAAEAKARLHAEDGPKSEPAKAQAPSDGVKLAKGCMTYRTKPNAGGYAVYCIDGQQDENGKDMRFSTKDPEVMATLNAHYEKEEAVGIEYVIVVGEKYTNYNIVGLVSVE